MSWIGMTRTLAAWQLASDKSVVAAAALAHAAGLLLAGALTLGCEEKRVRPEPLPASAATNAASANTSESASDYPEDYKLFLAADVSDDTVRAELSASAKANALPLELSEGEPKCRGVAFLDTEGEGLLRPRGLSLRLRQQLDGDCEKRSERLAISFNQSTKSREAARARREEMTLADGLEDRNTKDRYKVRHVMQPSGPLELWLVGGTVRRLAGAPTSVADLLTMFPHLTGLDGQHGKALGPIGGKRMFETNHDIGHLQLAHASARIELATIRVSKDGKPGAILARELSIELERSGDLAVAAFANDLARRLANGLLDLSARDDLVHGP